MSFICLAFDMTPHISFHCKLVPVQYREYKYGQQVSFAGHMSRHKTMALHPRENSTFAFNVVFTFYVCCPLFDITVSQCDIELATLEFHDATLKLSPPKFYLRFRCRFHILCLLSAIRHYSFTM